MKLTGCLLVVVGTVLTSTIGVNAETKSQLDIAIGQPGSDSFAFGTELWAMSQIALLPTHNIALNAQEVAADEDRLSLLKERKVDAALVYSRVPMALKGEVRSIMALWPEGISTETDDPVQILVHRDVPSNLVYLLTRAMFEHAKYFQTARARLGIGLPSEAMTGLDTPLHQGAYRYYREQGFGAELAVYHNFDDAALKPDEVDQVAAACRQALELGALTAVLGDLDTTGCEAYQATLLGDRRKPEAPSGQTVASTGSDDDADEPLFDSPSGQGGPAIRWTPRKSDGMKVGIDALRRLPPEALRQPTM